MGDQSKELNFDEHLKNLEKDPVFLRKRKATLICFFIRMFLLGAEYAVILPSVWLYLKRFEVQPWFLGFVIAIYPTAAVFSLLFAGRIYDKTKQTKEIVLFLNGFEIVGNIVYALPFSKWLVFSGRFIAGLGDGFYACAASEIVHTYPLADRTGALALLELGRTLGIILAPGLNFLFVDVNFSIGQWAIDKSNVAGVVMAILWILSQIFCSFYISNLSLIIKEKAICETSIELHFEKTYFNDFCIIDHKPKTETLMCDDTVGSDKQQLIPKVLIKNYQTTNGETYIQNVSSKNDETASPDIRDTGAEAITKHQGMLHHVFELLTTIEVLAIFYTDLILRLIQIEFEVFVPLITQERYGWSEKETSCVYMIGGVWLMILFLLIYKFSAKSKIKDQHYIMISLVLTTLALSILLIELFVPKQYRVTTFIVLAIFVFSSVPLNMVACKSLLTKITPRESQGVTQAVYMSVLRASYIVGPIIAGGTFSHRLAFSCVMIGLCTLAFVFMVSLLKRIKDKIRKMQEIET